MHNSDSIINFATRISSIVGVFHSSLYTAELESATLLDKAIEKLPPNMKQFWSLHTVKRDLHAPFLVDFNDWLEDEAEAHERMRSSYKPEYNSSQTKTAVKIFSANPLTKTETNPQIVPVCNVNASINFGNVASSKQKPQLNAQSFVLRASFVFLDFKKITNSGMP